MSLSATGMEHGQLQGLRADAFVNNVYQGLLSQHLGFSYRSRRSSRSGLGL